MVFCAKQDHAGLVRDIINQYAVKKGWTTNPRYCVRVTSNDGASGETDLRTFQDNEKTIPTILTTSRKLSTGVDARNVRNIVLMRPCNNMIEFKQIIGRGTRLFDGKEFFTIFDFVKAHQNFSDPEWDGDPIEVTTLHTSQKKDFMVAEPKPEFYSADPVKEPKREKIKIKLSDGKTRQIKHVSSIMYWSPEGKPITAREFVERMFEDLPQFFKHEDELRRIWQSPDTREKLLQELSDAGYDHDKLRSMQRLIEAEDSDIYDVLAYIAYNAEVLTRVDRAEHAKLRIHQLFQDNEQKEFIDFVLSKYKTDGVEELSLKKMRALLELKYHTVSDAALLFGSTERIRDTFVSFQKYLYQGHDNGSQRDAR